MKWISKHYRVLACTVLIAVGLASANPALVTTGFAQLAASVSADG